MPIAQGFTLLAEPFMYRHIKEFYDEVGGNQELWLMGVPDTMTMTGMLDNTDANAAKKLVNAAQGKIRLLAVTHKPAVGYAPGANFFDADVTTALTNAIVFCAARLTEMVPLRVLVEGRVTNDASVTIFQPKTAAAGCAGVVLGGSLNDGSASVGTALGRAVKYPAHIKIGKVANGPLAIQQIYIGTKLLKDVLNLDDLHGNGCISFMQHPNKAGFYFGVDRMASTDDYRLLVYGRVIDKAAIITQAVYIEDLEGEVDIDANGFIPELEIENLKGELTKQVELNMGDQISGLTNYNRSKAGHYNTGKLKIKERVQPKGYKSFIDVDLGLNAPSAS
jgi:hypothetical protein